MEKRQPLQQMLLGKVATCLQETETRSMSITLYCINSKWVKDLNIRSETLKLVQEGARNTLELLGIGKDFLKRTPAAQLGKGQTNGLHETKQHLHNKRNGL
jgi:hypothetical protein